MAGNFAQTQLLKYGWTEGKGLGKNENGLTEAIKPTLKFDKTGIGYNENDSEQWWETLYDNAVKNIKVDMHDNKVCLSTINDSKTMDGWNIVPSKKSKMKQYENFLKTSTLHNGHLISLQDISIEKEEKKTAKDSVYNPMADIKLNKFLDVITNSESQSNASLVKGNIMTHREIKIELDTEESEDPEKNQEMIADQNTSQHENFIFKSKSQRKTEKRRLNQLTQQFRICNLKRNNTDSKCISLHNKKLIGSEEEKDSKSQLNVKSGKCRKKKHKNKRKKRFEQNIQHEAHETASHYDIQNELENATKNLYSIKSKSFNLNTVISNTSTNKINKDIYETIITVPIDGDRRNMNIKQEVEEEKATGWEYFKTAKEEDFLLIKKFYTSVKGVLQKPSNKKIKKYIHQQKRVKKQLENVMSQKTFCTDDLNSVIKKLTTFDLSEEVSANALKKKSTQTHSTPV